MEDNEDTGTTSQESVKDSVETEAKQCVAIFLQLNLKHFNKTQNVKIVHENIDIFRQSGWRCIVENDAITVLWKPDLGESLDIQYFDFFLLSNFQVFSPLKIIASNEASTTGVDSCHCFKNFSILKNTLNSASTEQWVCFWICDGKTYLSIGEEQTSIPAEDFHQLQTFVGKVVELNNDASSIINTRVPLGETENKVKAVITSHIISQEEFFKESNEIVYQKCKVLKQLNTLLYKLCGSFENGEDSANKDEPPGVSSESTSTRNDDLHALQQSGGSVPLMTLLQCIIVRLTTSNWKELRRYVARDIPLRVLANIPDNIEFFEELERRNKIQIGNTEYIRSGFYEIGRVDLVHLLDCIQEGDYSLLTAERRKRGNASGLEGTTSSYLRRMRELTVADSRDEVSTDGHVTRSPPSVVTADTSEARDRPLQRRYRNVPQRTTPSTPFPVQEHTAENIRSQTQISANISNNEGGQSSQNRNTNDAEIPQNAEGSTPQNVNSEGTSQGGNTDDTHSRGENPVATPPEGASAEGANAEVTSSRDENSEDTRAWVMSREYACEHYDRYCEVKFACCESFWPCHRCHNVKSKCNEKKLKSRDIKKLKCRRCGKIQDFPKDSQHCVECNLKFADYFCPLCQHLTGRQNNPFHCKKCGICRYVCDVAVNQL